MLGKGDNLDKQVPLGGKKGPLEELWAANESTLSRALMFRFNHTMVQSLTYNVLNKCR